MLQERCYGKNRQYESLMDCITYMKKVPEHKMGWCPTFAGNTLSCRWMHSILAQVFCLFLKLPFSALF